MIIRTTRHALDRLAKRDQMATSIMDPRTLAYRAYTEGTEPPKEFDPGKAKKRKGEYLYKCFLGLIFVFVIQGQTADLVTIYRNDYKKLTWPTPQAK